MIPISLKQCTTPLARFLVAHGFASLATGAHLVALSWLAAGVLHLDAARIGWVQAASLLPGLAMIPVAGIMADRYNPARLLRAVHGLSAMAFAGFALLVYRDALSLPTLMLYAALIGTCNGVIQPVREKLLMQVQRVPLQRRISSASVAQFSCQSAGVLLVAGADYTGFALILAVQAVASLITAVSYSSLVGREGIEARVASEEPLLSALGPVLAAVRATAGLRQILFLAAFNGYMHLGVFVVALPVMARTYYGMDASGYALLQFTFVAGMILAHTLLLTRERVKYPGQGALMSLLYTGLAGLILARQPLPAGLYITVGFWGWVAGNSAGLSRMVLQSLAPFELKGRLMALYQLTLFGMAPLGALATGHLLHDHSPQWLFNGMAVSSGVLFVLFVFRRALWRVEQKD